MAYLTACNSLFERGILGKKVFVKSNASPIISNIESGYSYFSKWLDEHLDKGDLGFNTCFGYHLFISFVSCAGYSITETASRPFLSWQTWDLLRVMVYGFQGFCEDFLHRNPGYTIYPVRLNGSAIETFFSQLKYTAGGHLSGVNYATARASILSRGSVKQKHSGAYRSAPIHIRRHPIYKSKYAKSRSQQE